MPVDPEVLSFGLGGINSALHIFRLHISSATIHGRGFRPFPGSSSVTESLMRPQSLTLRPTGCDTNRRRNVRIELLNSSATVDA